MSSNVYEMRHTPSPAPGRPEVSVAEPKSPSTTQPEVPEERPQSMRSSITAREPRKIQKKRNYIQFYIVLFYIALTLVSWILLCQMTYKPYGRKSYFGVESDVHQPGIIHEPGEIAKKLRTNERYMRAMFIIRTIVTTLIIPVTGYVCAVAAMSYLHNNAIRSRITLEQSMAVADQQWANPFAWAHAGSLILYIGFGLMFLGVLSQILQTGFIQQEYVQVGTPDTQDSTSFIDVLRTVPSDTGADPDIRDDGRYVLRLRDTLVSGIGDGLYDRNRWSECEDGNSCAIETIPGGSKAPKKEVTQGRRIHYITPLKTNFTSGVHYNPQFLPRINSSLHFESISQETFKRECRNETESGAFYANYVHALQDQQSYAGGFNIEVCITGDLRASPWKTTRNRQDISETMYFSLVSSTLDSIIRKTAPPAYRKLTANTTLGFFELPSMLNGYRAGPLQAKNPLDKWNDQIPFINIKRAVQNNTTPSRAVPATEREIVNIRNLGPLSSLGLALFSYRSFVGVRMRNDTSFIGAGEESPKDQYQKDNNCVETTPFASFSSPCVKIAYNEYSVAQDVHEFLQSFDQNGDQWLSQGLNMTNYLFITGQGMTDLDKRYLNVNFDEGIKTIKPKISRTGIIVGSVFVGLHLLGLLILSVYNLIHSLPTSRLGAEVMVRMGVAHAELLQEAANKKEWDRFMGILPAFAEENNH